MQRNKLTSERYPNTPLYLAKECLGFLPKHSEVDISVIKIPERIHYGIEKGITVNGSKASQILIDAVKNGTPLPKGHGRLIYAKDVGEYLTLADVPTIIEADKAETEEE